MKADGTAQGNDGFRRMTAVDHASNERCEIGYNSHRFGPTAVYKEGQRLATFISVRLPTGFDLSQPRWQIVTQIKQTGSSSGASGNPMLELNAYDGRWRLRQVGHNPEELWSAPAQTGQWVRFAFDVVYSQDPAAGSVRVYADLNLDGDTEDSSERSGLITGLRTLKREPGGGDPNDGVAEGESIPSHLRTGLYHDPAYSCSSGCAVEVDNVQVVEVRGWRAASFLSSSGQDAFWPVVAVGSSGQTAATWRRFDGSNWRVQATVRSALSNWRSVTDLSDPGQDAFEGKIGVAGDGTAIAAWRRFNGSNWVVQSKVYSPSSQTWGSATNFACTANQDSFSPDLAVGNDGTAAVVFRCFDGSNWRIWTSVRPPGGAWGTPQVLSGAGQNAELPQVGISGDGRVVAVWRRFDGVDWRMEAAAKPPGGSWGTPEVLSASGSWAGEPQVDVGTNGAAVATWRQAVGSINQVQAKVLPAGGSWGGLQVLSTPTNTADSAQVGVASDNSAVAVWRELKSGNYLARQSSLPAGGGTFGSATDLSAAGQDAAVPQVALADNGDAIALWRRLDPAAGFNRVQAAARPAGGSWSNPSWVSPGGVGTAADNPQISVGPDGRGVAVWQLLDGAKQRISTGDYRFGDASPQVEAGDTTPPEAPSFTDTDPDSPANDNNPEVKGTAEGGSTVRLYRAPTTSDCSPGNLVATGTQTQFGSTGLTASVGDNTSTTFRATASDGAENTSPCSGNSITYVEDSTAPSAPTLTDTDPDSPANDNSPEVKGTAESSSTVRLYKAPTTSDCTATNLAAAGTQAQFASPGLTASVPDNSTTTFRATATDAAGNASACSTSSIGYVENSQVTIPPDNLTTNPSFEAGTVGWEPSTNASLSQVQDPTAPHGQHVARVSLGSGTAAYAIRSAGYTVPSTQAGATYTGKAYVKGLSGVTTGKPIRIKIREWTQGGSLVNFAQQEVILTDNYQPVQVSYNPAGSGNKLDIQVFRPTAGSIVAGDAFFVDAFTLVVQSAPPTCPLAQPGSNLTYTISSSCTVVRSDTAAGDTPDEWDPGDLWGTYFPPNLPFDCEPGQIGRPTSGGDTSLTATGGPQSDETASFRPYRSMTVFDGDNPNNGGERCEIGKEDWRRLATPEDQAGTFYAYHSGMRRATYLSIRLPANFPLGANQWQNVMQMRQSGPSDVDGRGIGGPVLTLKAFQGNWQLFHTDLPSQQDPNPHDVVKWQTDAETGIWTRIAFDAYYSDDPAQGWVKVYIDRNGDGVFASNPTEQSPIFETNTLMTEVASSDNPDQDGLDEGEPVPSRLSVGIYRFSPEPNDPYACDSDLDCTTHIDNVQVIAP